MRSTRFASLIAQQARLLSRQSRLDAYFRKYGTFYQKERQIVNNKFGQYEVVEPWTVSEKREVPQYIPHPYYVKTTKHVNTVQVIAPTEPEIKNEEAIAAMRHSCYLAKRVLNEATQYIKPGTTTDTVDEALHKLILYNGGYPSPLGYNGYPKSICTSINNVACHGIPDDRPLLYGDILNIDVTVYFNGYHGDCSKMFVVGSADDDAKRLISATELCLNKAIEICQPREDLSAIGSIIQETAFDLGFEVIPDFLGHGIGTYFHGPPDVIHVENDSTVIMKPGMTFTIEPVLTQGTPVIKHLSDGWTVVTCDDARTAQIEHTILITDNGCEILTL